MNNKPNISIVLTYYNTEIYLIYALSSILAQEDEFKKNNIYDFNIEVIIVNDASTDHSRDIAIKFLNDLNKRNDSIFDWKHYDNENNEGCGKSRKIGIEYSTGDYIMFLDADDYYINKSFLYEVCEALKIYNDSDILEFGIKSNINGHDAYQVQNNVKEFITLEEKLKTLFVDNIIRFYAWSKIVKRHIVEKIPYSENRTYEDVMTIPKWIEISNKITLLPILGINYRYTQNSITTSNGLTKRLGTIKSLCELCKHFKYNKIIVKMIYKRAMMDLEVVLNNHTSDDPGFLEMMKYNNEMLRILYDKN